MSDDPFVRENTVSTPWDDGHWDCEGAEELSLLPSATASLPPPHVKAACIVYHYKQQEQ